MHHKKEVMNRQWTGVYLKSRRHLNLGGRVVLPPKLIDTMLVDIPSLGLYMGLECSYLQVGGAKLSGMVRDSTMHACIHLNSMFYPTYVWHAFFWLWTLTVMEILHADIKHKLSLTDNPHVKLAITFHQQCCCKNSHRQISFNEPWYDCFQSCHTYKVKNACLH